MSGVAIVRYLLANNSNLIAQVPASRIMAGVLPIDTVLPAINVLQIDGIIRNTVYVDDAAKFFIDRVTVTVEAKTYATQKSLLALIRAALPLSRGLINGFNCDSILADTIGPDSFDPDLPAYIQSQDFIVKYNI